VQVHLIDGTYELFRAWFGAPQGQVHGREVGAVRSLVRSLALLLGKGVITHAGLAFDTVIESFRNELFAGYKTGEGIDPALWAQFPLAEAGVRALGITAWSMIDFEADDAVMAANRAAYGVAMPRISFADAKVIVSFSADFLEGWGASVPQQLDFAEARAKIEGAPRFIYVGPRRSLTGLNADQWIACKPGGELAIALFLRGLGSAADAAN
jgi:hypothetical protein